MNTIKTKLENSTMIIPKTVGAVAVFDASHTDLCTRG